jgi:NitT/TauT family transport system ATP-binding protein
VTHDPKEAVSLADRVLLLSPRPAHVLANIAITTPRRARSDAEMQGTMAAISEHLTAIRANGVNGGRI